MQDTYGWRTNGDLCALAKYGVADWLLEQAQLQLIDELTAVTKRRRCLRAYPHCRIQGYDPSKEHFKSIHVIQFCLT